MRQAQQICRIVMQDRKKRPSERAEQADKQTDYSTANKGDEWRDSG